MTKWQVAVETHDAFENLLPQEWLRGVALLTLTSEDSSKPIVPPLHQSNLPEEYTMGVGLFIADDETLRTLNREYTGDDEVTDVLSFPFLLENNKPLYQSLDSDQEFDFIIPDLKDGPPMSLGEVIVSYPQALRQSREANHTVQHEVALLVTHGILHLLGYDHGTPQEKAIMWKRQDAVLDDVFRQEAP